MKMIKKVVMTVTALIFIGSSVFAQSLADARKAIDAEQYQKAKAMLKNLTVTQPNKDENFFYLGWVYIKQDYADSAKAVFNKGIAVNPKSALNYAGLGAVARLDKNQALATQNFNQAISLAPRKDGDPYRYVGEAYLLPVNENNVVAPADANAAIAVLTKGASIDSKNADILVTLGNAYISQLKSNEAYKAYSDALGIDPKSLTANVAEGVLWRLANNWESAAKQFQAALNIDPNFGPAYREWAETDYRQARADINVASAKIKEAVDHYKKYLSLTDMSLESQLRYADFLVNAGDYKTLQEVATGLSKYAKINLRVYRYMAYAAYENKDYASGLTAMNKWMGQAGEKRIIPRDYLYLGRLQIATGADSLGVLSLKKAYAMDTTQADVFLEIAKNDFAKKRYLTSALDYQEYFDKSHKGALLDHYYQGLGYYFGYDVNKPDSTLLIKADSAFAYVNSKVTNPVAQAVIYRARINDLLDSDRNNIKGLAKPFYDQYISIVGAKTTPSDPEKGNLAEAYVYLGRLYEFRDKDDAKAMEAYTKAKSYDPNNKDVAAYFARKSGGGGKGK